MCTVLVAPVAQGILGKRFRLRQQIKDQTFDKLNASPACICLQKNCQSFHQRVNNQTWSRIVLVVRDHSDLIKAVADSRVRVTAVVRGDRATGVIRAIRVTTADKVVRVHRQDKTDKAVRAHRVVVADAAVLVTPVQPADRKSIMVGWVYKIFTFFYR